MLTLGINAAYHDSAACLAADGQVIAAAEEERFTRIKHGKRPVPFSAWELPFHAIHYCLREARIHLRDVDHIAYSFDPALFHAGHDQEQIALPVEPSAHPPANGWESAWDPLFYSYVVNAPRQLAGGVPHHLRERFHDGARASWHFVPHHLAHAASAFLPSPFDRAAVMVIDGRGEKATTSYWAGEGANLRALGEVRMPHSLGMLYERVTEHLGFLHSSDEYKVMALASYGEPAFRDGFQQMVQLGSNGEYTVRMPPLETCLGPARMRGEPMEQRHFDIARSLQAVLEESVLCLAQWLRAHTGLRHLCLAGGVALNCVMNSRLRDEGGFDSVWVQPAAGDAGTALGAAAWIDARSRNAAQRNWTMNSALLGPSYDEANIRELLDWSGLHYRRSANLAGDVAELLAAGKVLGWFQGRMEFGPRALGARSILASPVPPEMKQRMNDIKDREDFRPVAPAVLEEEAGEWFTPAQSSPFMLFVTQVASERQDRIPSACHVDGTARVQTVNRDHHPLFHKLLKQFGARTGVPVLINTSFNTRGEPIVQSPRDALESFWTTPLDALAIGPFLLEKQS